MYNLTVSLIINGFILVLFTSIGVLIAVFSRKIDEKGLHIGLGFAIGVMLAASFTSLIIPGFEEGFHIEVGVGILLGITAIIILDSFLPHEHSNVGYEGLGDFKRKISKFWLIALAMIIHNIPEGIAVGVSTVYNPTRGLLTALAIGIQDIPEGLAVTLSLLFIGVKFHLAVLLGLLSGLIEGLMTAMGGALALLGNSLGYGMGFAAGAMLYVTVEELIPEVFYEKNRFRRSSTIGFFMGVYLMLYLDHLFG